MFSAQVVRNAVPQQQGCTLPIGRKRQAWTGRDFGIGSAQPPDYAETGWTDLLGNNVWAGLILIHNNPTETPVREWTKSCGRSNRDGTCSPAPSGFDSDNKWPDFDRLSRHFAK